MYMTATNCGFTSSFTNNNKSREMRKWIERVRLYNIIRMILVGMGGKVDGKLGVVGYLPPS